MDHDGNQEPNPHWRVLAEKASKEQDGEKLSQLVGDLCDQLDQEAERRTTKPTGPENRS